MLILVKFLTHHRLSQCLSRLIFCTTRLWLGCLGAHSVDTSCIRQWQNRRYYYQLGCFTVL